MNRRHFITTVGATALVANLQSSTAQAKEQKPKLVRDENAKPGALDWQLTRVKVDKDGFRSPAIEGYCSRQSVKAGESIDVFVSTSPIREFRLEVFRMGYYGGSGARKVAEYGPFAGVNQPTPTPGEKNIHECQWEKTTTITVPTDWMSGVYIGRLTTTPQGELDPYWQSYITFIVTDDRPADILFQCSDNTWQAYNRWPNNYSIYTHPKGNQGPWAQVSFDRPYGREAQHAGVVNDPLTVGSGEFLPFEFPLAYWLEENGYDVTYCANSDMLTPERGLRCKSFISVGHDEYWDIRQFRSVETMRDAGVHLLFLSGNSVCWVSPFSANSAGIPNRRIFRGGPYGADNDYAKNRQQNNGPFPEHGPDEGLLMGARNVEPVNGGGDWICVKPEHWIFRGTNLKKGDSIPGLIGWEYHGQPATEIPSLEVVGAGTAWVGGVKPQQWTATIYEGPKGNFVFNAATISGPKAFPHRPDTCFPGLIGAARTDRINASSKSRAICWTVL